MNELILTKESTESEIKTYFQRVLELKRSGEEFPVDLELVWPLVYSEKSKAVRALTSDFIQDVDYQFFALNGENSGRGRPTDSYKLTVPCMEYFIARKVRNVFEVYRKVFHKVAEQKPLSPAEMFLQNAQLMVEHDKRISEVENKIQLLEAKTLTRPDEFTIVGYATVHGMKVSLPQASAYGKKATKICNERGYLLNTIPDPRFGKVKMYPTEVLHEVFNLTIN